MTNGNATGDQLRVDDRTPAVEAAPLLELSGVDASYGAVRALRGVSLSVLPGRVHAVLGANGAGKTTLLNVVAGLHAPERGEVVLAGRRIDGLDAAGLARCGLCLVPEGRGVFPNLTVGEHLWLLATDGRKRTDVEDAVYGRFPRLGDRRNQLAGVLSGGEQQMLALARGLATDPALLLLDELSQGLAPTIVEELYGLVAEIAADGVPVLVVEQFARVVLPVAASATVLASGRVVLDGPVADIESQLTEAYFDG
jgi:branched-chain amino acid transport system ATP-binding protein